MCIQSSDISNINERLNIVLTWTHFWIFGTVVFLRTLKGSSLVNTVHFVFYTIPAGFKGLLDEKKYVKINIYKICFKGAHFTFILLSCMVPSVALEEFWVCGV